jgi:hypothetical protein
MSASTEKDAIRAEIERTRGDMSRTVDQIEERLSPAHLKEQIADVKQAAVGEYHEAKDHVKADLAREISEAKARVAEEVRNAKRTLRLEMRQAKHAVHQATVGKVRHMADDARTSIVDTIRENPIPSAMIAIGLGWLLMGGGKRTDRTGVRLRSAHDHDGYDLRSLGDLHDDDDLYGFGPERFGEDGRSAEGVRGRIRRGAEEAIDSVRDGAAEFGGRARDGAGRLADRAGGVLHDVSDAASSFAERAGGGIEHLAHDARDAATELAGDARRTGRRVARSANRQYERAEAGFENALRENPLAVGAVALAVGAAIGLGLPHTEKEDDWMGETKDRLLDRARGRVEGVAQRAVQTAHAKVDEIAGDGSSGREERRSTPRESSPNVV